MGIYLYDSAITSKIKFWTENTQLTVFSPEDTKQLFEITADKKDDRPITFPLLTISRTLGYSINNANKQPLSYGGMVYSKTDETSLLLDAIPVTITYQIDLYTRRFKEADMYARNLVFNFVNYPILEIIIPYRDINYSHNSTIRVNPEIVDSSSTIRQHTGQISRVTFSVNVDDAYIWDVRKVGNVCMDDNQVVMIKNPNTGDFSTETIHIN